MKRIALLMAIAVIFSACSSSRKAGGSIKGLNYGSPYLSQTLLDEYTFLIEEFSQDETYGYTQKNPIMVGGSKTMEGPLNQRRFLNALAGPNGEKISYNRLGSCCVFRTKNGLFGDSGLLDMYEITHSGLEKPIVLYLNMYDSDTLKVPVGFTLRY